MSSTSVSGSASGSRRPLVIVLAVLGILAIILGILYVALGSSLPSFLTAGSHVHHGGHIIRAVVCWVVGVALLIGAWFTNRAQTS